MDIYIDDVKQSGMGRLKRKDSILDRVMNSVTKNGRILESIKVDEVTVDSEITSDVPPAFLSVSGGQEIRFVTRNVAVLVRETLEEAVPYCSKVALHIIKTADMLEADKISDAYSTLGQIAEGVDWLMHVLDRCFCLLGMLPTEISPSDFNTFKESIANSLSRISESIENNKHLEMSFRLRTDLHPTVVKMCEFLNMMQKSSQASLKVN